MKINIAIASHVAGILKTELLCVSAKCAVFPLLFEILGFKPLIQAIVAGSLKF